MPGPAGPPQFLVIGHLVQDLPPEQISDAAPWRLGGTVSYAATLAARLGLRTAALTAATADLELERLLPGVDVLRVPSPTCTQMRNVYTAEGRVQYVPSRAAPLHPEALPEAWRDAEIVLLGPVAREVDDAFADCFSQALMGVSAQGWLRDIRPDGRVRPLPPLQWDTPRLLRPGHTLFVSDEDLLPSEARPVLEAWSARVQTLAYTRAERGADVCHRGYWRHIDAFPAKALDPTGAGDVFAAACLIRYRETGDPWDSVRFATAAASLICESVGLADTPDRPAIDARLREHPDIIAR